MESILFVSKDQDAFRQIRSGLRSGFRIENVNNKQAALQILKKKNGSISFLLT